MLNVRNTTACAAGALWLFATSCGGGGSNIQLPSDPKGTVEAIVHHVGQNNPEVLWVALPPSYQSDVTGLVHDFAAKMDAELYDQTFALLRKIVGVMRDKKDFILDHPMARNVDSAEAHANWDQVVGLFDTIVNSDLSSTSSLRSLDIGDFLRTDGHQLMQQFSALSKLSPEDPMAILRQASVELVKESGETATLKLSVPNKPAEEVRFMRIEGKWLPMEMVEGWDKAIAEAHDSLEKMPSGTDEQSKAQAQMIMAMVEAVVDRMAAANSQEEFNAALSGIMGMAAPGK